MPTTKNTETPETKAKAALGDAGASTNPLVHKALADLETAQRNDDETGAKDAEKRLTDLGVAL